MPLSVTSGEIRGSVFSDLNADGQRDDEPPLQGWTVFLDRNNNGLVDEEEPVTQTDAAGRYLFRLLEPNNTYRVRQLAEPLWSPTFPLATNPHDIHVETGQVVERIDFANHASVGTLSGKVFNDLNGDGVEGRGELGIGNWTLFLDQNGNSQLDDGERSLQTDADGTWLFSGLAPGAYRVLQQPFTGWVPTAPLADDVFREVFVQDGSPTLRDFEVGGSWQPLATDTGGSAYFGEAVDSFAREAAYRNYTRGNLISPVIDLRGVAGTVVLRVEQFLELAEVDLAQIRVIPVDGPPEVIANSRAGALSTVVDGAVDISLSPWTGQQIQLEFLFAADLERERIDQVMIDAEAGLEYIVEVRGFDGETHPRYDLTIDAPGTAKDLFDRLDAEQLD